MCRSVEVTFDGMERATQQERFEKLNLICPEIGRACDPALLPAKQDYKQLFAVNSILGLRTLELALYFQQDRERIARCGYCWNYFIPKTKKETHYCDRMIDGFSCKQRGARFKRNLKSFAYLNMSKEDPQWEYFSADDLRRRDQEGHQSLREKYGKG